MVTRRVSKDLLAAAKSSLTRRVTSCLLRFAAKVSAIGLAPKRLSNARQSYLYISTILYPSSQLCQFDAIRRILFAITCAINF